MARKLFKLPHYLNMLLNFILYSVFWQFVHAYHESSPATSAPNDQQALRLHSGVIASVVVVIVGATAAAVFIIRKYCCQQSNVTYRYSELQQMEEQNAAREADDDSDEDLLE